MNYLSYVFIVLTIFIFVQNGQGQQGDAICEKKTKSNEKWYCRKISECQSSSQLLNSKQASFCGHEKHSHKICCPYQVDPVKIAQEKCLKYSEARFVDKIQRSLIPGQKDIISKVLDCAKNVEKLIIGGTAAKLKEFPHMALVGRGKDPDDISWICGGSLISDQYVLSAAHCSDPRNHYSTAQWILLGILYRPDDKTQMNSDNRKNLYRIIERRNHPLYKSPKQDHDIALFKLERPIKFTALIRPICLSRPANASTDISNEVIVSGWGQTAASMVESEILLKAKINRVEDRLCRETYASETKFSKGFDAKMMICAGHLKEAKDTCKSDSGGPLQVEVADEAYKCMWFQEGITSVGALNCGNHVPGVYTKVSSYLPWIQSIVWP